MLSNGVNAEHKLLLDDLLLNWPGVRAGKLFSYVAYRISGKVFAVWCGGGLALKLPEPTVESLIAAGRAGPFAPAPGILWHEWAHLPLATADQVTALEPLLREAVRFTDRE